MRSAGVGDGDGDGDGVAVWAGTLFDAVAIPRAESSLINDRRPTRVFLIFMVTV
jgi:hypothetical protein